MAQDLVDVEDDWGEPLHQPNPTFVEILIEEWTSALSNGLRPDSLRVHLSENPRCLSNGAYVERLRGSRRWQLMVSADTELRQYSNILWNALGDAYITNYYADSARFWLNSLQKLWTVLPRDKEVPQDPWGAFFSSSSKFRTLLMIRLPCFILNSLCNSGTTRKYSTMRRRVKQFNSRKIPCGSLGRQTISLTLCILLRNPRNAKSWNSFTPTDTRTCSASEVLCVHNCIDDHVANLYIVAQVAISVCFFLSMILFPYFATWCFVHLISFVLQLC